MKRKTWYLNIWWKRIKHIHPSQSSQKCTQHTLVSRSIPPTPPPPPPYPTVPNKCTQHTPVQSISVHSTHQSNHLNLPPQYLPPPTKKKKKLTQLTLYCCPVHSPSLLSFLNFSSTSFFAALLWPLYMIWISDWVSIQQCICLAAALMAGKFPNFPEDDLYSIMLVVTVSYPKFLLQCLLLCHQSWQCPLQTLARVAQNSCSFSSCMTRSILSSNASLKDCDTDSQYCDTITNLKLTCECILN